MKGRSGGSCGAFWSHTVRMVPIILLLGLGSCAGLGDRRAENDNECQLRAMRHGHVCVCTSERCDSVPPIPQIKGGQYAVFSSTEAGKRLSPSGPHSLESKAPGHHRNLQIDPDKTYQSVLGFGNAFTDAAAINFDAMDAGVQEQLLLQYWGSDADAGGGIGMRIGRVPIASSDFSTHVYSYDDVVGDTQLQNFSIEMDETVKLPLIRRALEMAARSGQGGLKLFASPWAPPAWMTDTNTTVHNPRLRPEMAKFYADYLVRFFIEYGKKGINFWGMTAQNEPAGNTGKWQDLKFSAESQRDFVRDHLGPALKGSNATAKLALMILDDQRIHLPGWVDTVMDDPDAARYVAGVGVHWYAAVEDETPSALYFGKLKTTHDRHPNLFILATEACEGFLPWSQGVRLGSWSRAETYAHDIMGDMGIGSATGWVDWNAFLSEDGGPNWAGNFVDSPIILNTTSRNEFYKQPMFYALAHFSAFVPPGSVRIHTESTTTLPVVEPPMEAIAFRRPDGLVTVIVLNRSPFSVSFQLRVSDTAWADFANVAPHSFHSILINVDDATM